MTYSLIARDPADGRLAVAVATCHFAAGAFVPHTQARTGAVATQGETNPLFGFRGLDLMQAGHDAAATLAVLLDEDSGRDFRQVHLMDAGGRSAAWTGQRTAAFAGHLSAENASVAGNFLAAGSVLQAVLDEWLQQSELPWPERLHAAMYAGETAGGDRRGRQSAALRIHGNEPYADLDLRIDNSPDPLGGLEALIAEARKPYVLEFRQTTPRLADPGRTPEAVGTGPLQPPY